MAAPLVNQCFEQGVSRRLLKLATGLSKSAVVPAAARAALSSLRSRELGVIGEKLFRAAGQTGSPLSGLKATVLPGFGQMGSIKRLIASYPGLYRAARTPSEREMVKRMFRQQLDQAFSEMGAVAEPKMKFWGKTMPVAAGGTAGMGMGLAGGAAGGAFERQRSNEQQLRNMPLWDRMKYLILPQSLDIKPKLPYEIRATTRRELPGGI